MPAHVRLNGLLPHVFDRLLAAYGPQRWWPGDTPFEVMVGAVLTQSAAWGNVEKAIANLKSASLLDPQALRRVPTAELASVIHPCGYYNSKAKKLKELAEWLGNSYGDSIEAVCRTGTAELREELLNIYGVGEETADSILLYACGKPVFVVDAYTMRVLERLGALPEKRTYHDCQEHFMKNLPADSGLFNEYHALLVRHGKESCRKAPLCDGCCLAEFCSTGSSEAARAPSGPDV